ncbi:MAG TPA: DUF1326 domain-containing protein [Nevskiaceae bacterium]
MAETIPAWHANGEWFDVCSCSLPCPCEFAQAPTNDHCDGVLAFVVHEGRYGDVALHELNVVLVGAFDGNLWEGGARQTVGIYLDERADADQRHALQQIFSGAAGGWPANYAKVIKEVRGVEAAAIEIVIEPDLARWHVRVGNTVEASAEALTGPTTPPGKRVQLINPPGSEVGSGQVATWGTGVRQRVDAFGFKYDLHGVSSKHIPFAWSSASA